MLMSVPLDADWSTLPARSDFVPFLHEMLFVLASGQSQHNVDVGVPLLHQVPADFPFNEYHFIGPGDTQFDAERAGDELKPVAKLSDTKLPGVYRLVRKDEGMGRDPIWFVVNFNRNESDLTELTAEDKEPLSKENRLTFADDVADMKQQMLGGESRTEFWPFLMLTFLGMLIAELLMTRRLVKGGHADVTNSPDEAIDADATEVEPLTREPSHA